MRATKEEKQFLLEAATLAGFTNLTSFIMVAAKKEAQQVIERHHQRILSDRDRDIVLQALEHPPEPNKHLKQLLV
jgi:uncharacterized protein (DUF1778 family)